MAKRKTGFSGDDDFYEEELKRFLKGVEQISEASKKIIALGSSVADIKDVLRAREQFDDLQIKPFGDGGSHIVLRGHAHVGKKTKVIIKE